MVPRTENECIRVTAPAYTARDRERVRAPSTTSARIPRTVLNMARASTKDRVATAVRLPVDLHEELQRRAEERDVSENFLMTRAVQHYLRQLGEPDPLTTPGPSDA